jgi:catechol 2,3-dioxygenase-like lactoylglutathione lyase family enzyme
MPPFHHIGYWVSDLDEAVDTAVRTLGVGPFLVHPHVRFQSFTLQDGTQIDDPAYFDHTAAFAAWGPIVLELGQVHSAEPALAEAYGLAGEPARAATGVLRASRVGHVSWIVGDLEAESERLEQLGCRLIHTASLGAVSVAWHEGGALFPHPIEVHRAGAPILGMHARLRSLAEGWDGNKPLRPMGG